MTAVEWLFQVWVELEHIAPEQWEMAKEMEKQQIISDESIIKLANEHILYNDTKRQWVIEGMKLYREQLKKNSL